MDNVCCGGARCGFHYHLSLIPTKVAGRVDTNYLIPTLIQTTIVLPRNGWCWMGSSAYSPAIPSALTWGEFSFSLGPRDQPRTDSLKKSPSANIDLYKRKHLSPKVKKAMDEWRKWLLWRTALTALWFLKCSLVRLDFESSFHVSCSGFFTSCLCLLAFPQHPRVFLGNLTLFTFPVFPLH